MERNKKQSTISVYSDDLPPFQRLSAKSHFSLIDIMSQLSKCLNVMLEDGLQESDRISFMIDADLANSMIHMRFAPILGIGQLPDFIKQAYQEEQKREDGFDTSHVTEKTFEVSPERFNQILEEVRKRINASNMPADQKILKIQALDALQKGE